MTIGARHRPIRSDILGHAKRMRHSPTDAEAVMRRLLRDRRFSKFKFRRQFPFRDYILDFVEIDGSQNVDSKRDEQRDAVLITEGFRVVRCWNNDVLRQRRSVMEDLLAKLELPQG